VALPDLVGVFFHLNLYSQLADGTDYYIDAVVVTGQDAPVVIRSRVLCAVNPLAPVTFEGQKVLLLTFPE
jgi:hypothetical protein